MTDDAEKICCGDTEHCQDCIHREAASEAHGTEVRVLTKNALGRCDFYSGPNRLVKDTAAL